jgi:PadR family transcriptional regulator, regulatory protein PadR
MRISGQGLQVLSVFLASNVHELSGADLAKATGIGSGTLYPLLMRFEDAGWLTSEWEDVDPSEVSRPRRRYYRLTALGERGARVEFQKLGNGQMTILGEGPVGGALA